MDERYDISRWHRPQGAFNWAWLVFLLGSLMVWTVLAFFSYPVGDEFYYGAAIRETGGFFDWCSHVYFHYWGRYTTTALYYPWYRYVDFLHWNWAGALLFLAGMLWSLHHLIRALVGRDVTPVGAWVMTLVGCLAFFGMAGHPRPLLYWINGAFCYTTSIMGFFWLIALLLGDRERDVRRRDFVLGIFYAAFIVGCNETAALFVMPFLFVGCIVAYLGRASRRHVWTACLAAAVVGALVIAFSPGNAQRGSHAFSDGMFSEVVLRRILSGVLFSFRQISLWISHPLFWCVTLLALPMMARVAVRRPYAATVARWWVVAFALTWLLLVVVSGVIPMLMLMHLEPPYHVRNVMFAAFAGGWFFLLHVVLSRQAQPVEVVRVGSVIMRGAMIFLVLSLLLKSHQRPAMRDLARRVVPFRAQMLARFDVMREAERNGLKDVVVEPIENAPLTVFWQELHEKPSDYPNEDFAAYFRVDTVRLSHGAPNEPDFDE